MMEARVTKEELDTAGPMVAVAPPSRFALSPINSRRWQNFKANRRGFYSLWIFLALCVITMPAEFIANDQPLLVSYDGGYYWPVFNTYPETAFGGEFQTAADYRDPYVQELIAKKGGWMLWPPLRYSYRTINLNLPEPAPAHPSAENPLGTDDQGRDVLARVIYGFRISVLFGLTLTILSSVIGVAAGAVQGYFGGWVDLVFQRFIEIWTSIPTLYLLIILASVIAPSFWMLLGIMLAFNWVSLVGVVRAEFLRGRNFEYIHGGAGAGAVERQDHVQASPAERHGGDAHLHAIHPQRLDHDADLARLPRLRPAARLPLAGRIAGAGQGQSAGAMAGTDGVLRHRHHAEPADLRRRGGARRLRSAQDL